MPVSVGDLIADLRAETLDLRALLDPLDDAAFAAPTPAAGWTIRDQVTHLAFFDDAAVLAVADGDRFRTEAAELMAAGMDFPDRIAAGHAHLTAAAARDWFATARTALLDVYGGLPARTRLPWFGPDMSVASALTARIMETWAHGQDVADALGAGRTPTDRLRHIAHLGVSTRGFSYALRGRTTPDAGVRVELRAPSGTGWTWGDPGAADRVIGPALDFCLVVTQRRHVDDTTLTIEGDAAAEWMSMAQAFAGAPGPGRARRTP
ncbi:TIGR03084 family metal-binding protein [Actinoplanes sp. NPDC049265]|uniref:TIGR03084 family metal-binding protein n=1 Tax=Actinoplanes sp. NPDC049265 TaxID=3363902 RepID=UPI003720FBA6